MERRRKIRWTGSRGRRQRRRIRRNGRRMTRRIGSESQLTDGPTSTSKSLNPHFLSYDFLPCHPLPFAYISGGGQ